MNGFFGRKTVAGSHTTRTFSRLMMTSALVAAGTFVLSSPSLANNSWGHLGDTGFSTDISNPNVTNITVTTANQKAIGIGNANIDLNDTVNVLNSKLFVVRDNRLDPTYILGKLNSTGKVIIIDGNGIFFGKDSVVNVGSIIATTGDLTDAQALANADTPLLFTNLGTEGVENAGSISASGLVAFVAPTVKNSGIINANLGRVSLAAGKSTATVDLYGDGLVELDAGSLGGLGSKFLSENTGKISGAQIQMTAAAAKDVVDSVVNMQGVLHANSAVVNQKGQIVLSAGKVSLGTSTPSSAKKIDGHTEVKATQLELGLTVDGNVSGSAKEVTILSDAAKINQGLSVIAKNGTVKVAAGTYDEDLVVNVEGVTVKGAKAGISGYDATRNGLGETIITPHSPGVVVAADNVTIDGLTIAGGNEGIEVFGFNGAVLQNNIITNSASAGYPLNNGIYVTGSANTKILNNYIFNTGDAGSAAEQGSGIRADKTTNLVIDNNKIDGAVWDAIKLEGGTNATVQNNDLDNLKRVGIYARGVNGLTLSKNDIDVAGLYGIQVDSVLGNVLIDSNSIDSIGLDAISVRYSDNGVKITNNKIGYGNDGLLNITDDTVIGRDGMAILYSAGTEATGNKIAHTKRDGIRVEGKSSVVLSGNNVDLTSRNGMYLLKTSKAQVADNKIGTIALDNNINGDGILVEDSNLVSIKRNTITETTSTANEIGSGVNLVNSTNVTVGGSLADKNIISNTEWDAVKVANGSNIFIEDNDFDNLKRAGVYAKGTNGITVRNNDIDIAGMYGIQFDNVIGSNIISGNKIDRIGLDAISIRYNSNNVQVLKNIIGYGADEALGTPDDQKTGRDGISIVYSKGTNVQENKIANSMRNGIYAEQAKNTTVDGNIIDLAKGNGVYLNGASFSNVINNAIGFGSATPIGLNGVKISGSSDMNVSDNDISNASLNGIYVVGASGTNTINRNDVYQSGQDGIFVDGSTGSLAVNENSVYDSAAHGIEVLNPAGTVQINGNDVHSSGWNGIYVHGAGMSDKMALQSLSSSDVDLEIIGNLVEDSDENGIALSHLNGSINVETNDISNSLNDGIFAEYVNRNVSSPMLALDDSSVPYQLTIYDNDIDNSANNGVELYEVGGLVTIDSNHITDSASNGILAYNSGSLIESEGFARQAFAGYRNPIELHIVDNTIENIGFGDVTEEGESSAQAKILAGNAFASNYNPFGHAAVNLDISGEGYAELSGNSLGNNFDYGLVAYSGMIDLTGATNTIRNTNIGMGFYPTDTIPETDTPEYFDYLAGLLTLVNDTIGTTAFVDQSQLFVDLGYGAFYAPGTPTILDGNNATYTLGASTIDPALNGGVTSDEYTTLETRINHYVDAQNRGLFFFNVFPTVSPAGFAIDQKDVLRNVFGVPSPSTTGGSLTITALPNIGLPTAPTPTPGAAGGAFNPNLIEPAAGDESGTGASDNDVANIQPAAGGDTACWSDATTSLGQGSPVTFNFGSGPAALLQDAVNCGSGQSQAQRGQGQAL